MGAPQVATPVATREATLGDVRASVSPGRRPGAAEHLVVARGTSELRTDVEVPTGASLGLEALDVGAASARLMAVRVDAALSRRFVVVDVHSARPRVLGTLGPFPADEEHGASLVARRGAGEAELVIGVDLRFSDSCGTRHAIVSPHRVDLARGTFAAEGPMIVEAQVTAVLRAEPLAPDAARPRFSGFSLDSLVTERGASTADLAASVDEDPNTAVPSSDARLGALDFRYPYAPLRLRGLVIDPVRGPRGGRALLLQHGDRVERIEVPFAAGAARITFDPPIDGRCLRLTTTGEDDSARGIATLYALPEADGDDAVQRLVAELADDGERSDLAVQALARVATPALPALEATFAEATQPERMRILEVARAMVAREPNALRLFVLALESGDEAVSRMALQRCTAMGAPCMRALAVAVRRGNAQVARTLAERSPRTAIEPLLARLAEATEPREISTLRDALGVAGRREADVAQPALRAFVVGDAPPDSRAAALAVMVELQDREGLSGALDAFVREAGSVAATLRALEAVALLPANMRSDAQRAFVEASAASDVWMVRAYAVQALAGDPNGLARLRETLADPYPRVRAAAVVALADDAASLRRIGELSRRDEWPLVRLAALIALAPMPEAEPLLRDALADGSVRVRVGIFDWMGEHRDPRFAAEATGIVERGRAPTPLVLAAVEYLERICHAPAQGALVHAVERAMGAENDRATRIGVAAAHALERLGDEDAVRAARRLIDPTRSGMQPPSRCTAPGGSR